MAASAATAPLAAIAAVPAAIKPGVFAIKNNVIPKTTVAPAATTINFLNFPSSLTAIALA
jgi:hypothetical protein